MKILIVSTRAPQKDGKGDALTVHHLIKYLRSRGHEIVLAAFVERGAEANVVSAREDCVEVVGVSRGRFWPLLNAARGLLSSKPLQVWFYWNRKMDRAVRRLIEQHEPDLIYAHYIRMAEYVRSENHQAAKVLAMQLSHAKNYFDMAEYGKVTRLLRSLYRIEAKRTLRYEFDVMSDFDQCMLISQKERDFIDPDRVRDNVFFNPHGVDSDFYTPQPEVEKVDDKLVFTGSMDFHPNADAAVFFVKEILPLIREKRPSVTLDIVGREPTSEVMALHDPPVVTVTGAVPDIRPYVSRAVVNVIPIRAAAGLQNKLLIAMSMGAAVVCTSQGNGIIGASPGRDVVQADTPEDFADAVVHLLSDDQKRAELGLNARAFILEKWTWEVYLAELEEMFVDMAPRSDRSLAAG